MSTRSSGTGNTRRERAAALQAARQRAEQRRRRTILAAVVIVVLAVGGIIAGVASSGSGSKKPAPAASSGSSPGPEGVAIQQGTPLAPITTAAKGDTVQGVSCQSSEQPAYHIHTHLAVYVDGKLRPITAGVGIVEPQSQQGANPPFYGATNCYYWLHVHTQDGVIHVESPTTRKYTLGQFFAIWGQPLSKTRSARRPEPSPFSSMARRIAATRRTSPSALARTSRSTSAPSCRSKPSTGPSPSSDTPAGTAAP